MSLRERGKVFEAPTRALSESGSSIKARIAALQECAASPSPSGKAPKRAAQRPAQLDKPTVSKKRRQKTRKKFYVPSLVDAIPSKDPQSKDAPQDEDPQEDPQDDPPPQDEPIDDDNQDPPESSSLLSTFFGCA